MSFNFEKMSLNPQCPNAPIKIRQNKQVFDRNTRYNLLLMNDKLQNDLGIQKIKPVTHS